MNWIGPEVFRVLVGILIVGAAFGIIAEAAIYHFRAGLKPWVQAWRNG